MSKVTFVKETHSYYIDGEKVPSVTQLIQAEGLADYSFIKSDTNKEFGSNAHETCELYDLSNLDEESLDVGLIPYLDSWKKFKTDYKVNLLEIERVVYSSVWKIAGTLDRILTINGENNRLILGDIKTGGVQALAAGIQTAGYKKLYEEETKLKIRERWVVQLLPDKYQIHKCKDPSDENVFLSALVCYNRKRKEGLITL